jgi:hypothetical protein
MLADVLESEKALFLVRGGDKDAPLSNYLVQAVPPSRPAIQ